MSPSLLLLPIVLPAAAGVLRLLCRGRLARAGGPLLVVSMAGQIAAVLLLFGRSIPALDLPMGGFDLAFRLRLDALSSFVLSAAAAPFFRTANGTGWSAEVVRWPVLALAAGVVLIELGFVLAYRSGDMLQWSGVAVNGASAMLLVPIALLLFRESFSLSRVLGIVLTLAGLALLTRR